MREQCEVMSEDCEVFTRCHVIVGPNGATITACPTCAVLVHDALQALVNGPVRPVSPPMRPTDERLIEYVDGAIFAAYGDSVALCQ